MKRAFAIVLLALAGCGKTADQPVRIVTYPLLGHSPLYLAQDFGHFREEGVAVELDELNSGPKMVEALVGGSAEIAVDGYLYPVIMAAQGRQLKTFFTIHEAMMGALVAGPSSRDRIRNTGELKNAIVGVGSTGGLHSRMLAWFLSRAGLTLQDVQLVPIGVTATAVAAIQYRKVDAAMIGSAMLPHLKQKVPGFRMLIDPRSPEQSQELFGVRKFPGTGMFATSRWLAQNPEKALRLARALSRTLRWMREHSAEEVLARVPKKLRGENAEFDLEELRVLLPILSKDGRMPAGGPEAAQRVVAASLEAAKSIDLAGTWTGEFIEEAK